MKKLMIAGTILAAVAAYGQSNTFPTSGNVGIGTTNPQYPLSVPVSSGVFGAYSDATHYGKITPYDGNGFMAFDHLWNSSSGGYKFENGGSDLVTILGGGNVGIGTTSPTTALDVVGNVKTGSLEMQSFALSNSWIADNIYYSGGFKYRGSAAGTVAYFEGGDFEIRTAPVGAAGSTASLTQVFTVKQGGNVGIGTTNPTQKLSVNGTIRAKEVIVDTGWSDYVFKPDYHLASLSEVEGAIQNDGHLPGIPSASEVAEHGISVGDMQAKLLAKIEELTLHQIEQEKIQAGLSAQLVTQNARLETQQAEIRALKQAALK